jgi:carbonic anhydrase
MEFFNGMFLNNAMKSGEQPASSEPAPTGAEPKVSEPAPTGSVPAPAMIEDFLAISSYEFLRPSRFPPIVLPTGEKVPIQLKKDNFRVNSLFKTGKSEAKTEFGFWFRLTGTHIYYAASKTDLNILGAIDVESIEEAEYDENDDPKFCFKLKDMNQHNWKLCGLTEKIRAKWICRLKFHLGLIDKPTCDKIESNKKADVTLQKIEIENKKTQPIILIPLPSHKCNDKWNYESKGGDWECGCKEGKEQSPIDLPNFSAAIPSPVAPLFDYQRVSAVSDITTLDGQLKSKEHIKLKYYANALRIFHPNFGKLVTLDGTVYHAEEIVFHTPSEHTIDGKRYDMEMQVIHYGQSKGDIAKQVVLSFLFEKKPGIYNKFLDDVDFFDLPNPLMKSRDITSDLFIPKVLHSADDSGIVSSMKPFSFYTYTGSLTFPPCSEKTIHYVASEPIPIASAPLDLMKEALMNPDVENEETKDLYVDSGEPKENYRDVQPLNGRPVFYFDHKLYCGQPAGSEYTVKKSGHYEKYNKKMTQYFYVNSETPSGLPGSYLVDQNEAKGIKP